MNLLQQQNPTQFQTILKKIHQNMLEYQKKAQYDKAEQSKLQLEQGKKYLKNLQLNQIHLKQKNEIHQLNNQKEIQIQLIIELSTQKVKDFQDHSQKIIKDLQQKHIEQRHKLREQLQTQLSTKVKESIQLMNLRKMQQQMAKQKNFIEAHRVQQKIKKLYNQQFQNWMLNRQKNIQIVLRNLDKKYENQLNNLENRIKISEEQNAYEFEKEKNRIIQKYDNMLQDLRAKHQRQVISFKGQFRNKGGSSSPVTSQRITLPIKV